MKVFNMAACFFGLHKYNPVFNQRWIQYSKGTRKRHVKSQFTCIHCWQKTKWLNRKDTEAMLDSDICDWDL